MNAMDYSKQPCECARRDCGLCLSCHAKKDISAHAKEGARQYEYDRVHRTKGTIGRVATAQARLQTDISRLENSHGISEALIALMNALDAALGEEQERLERSITKEQR